MQYNKCNKTGIKTYIASALPKYVNEQGQRAKKNCRALYKNWDGSKHKRFVLLMMKPNVLLAQLMFWERSTTTAVEKVMLITSLRLSQWCCLLHNFCGTGKCASQQPFFSSRHLRINGLIWNFNAALGRILNPLSNDVWYTKRKVKLRIRYLN